MLEAADVFLLRHPFLSSAFYHAAMFDALIVLCSVKNKETNQIDRFDDYSKDIKFIQLNSFSFGGPKLIDASHVPNKNVALLIDLLLCEAHTLCYCFVIVELVFAVALPAAYFPVPTSIARFVHVFRHLRKYLFYSTSRGGNENITISD